MKLQKNKKLKESFKIDGVKIDVNYKALYPSSNKIDGNEIIIVLPGWSINADTKSAEMIGQAFSDTGNCKVLVIDTKPDEIVNDALFKESKAIKSLVDKQKETKITIAGYSEGGIKAINLTTLLQNKRNLKVKGLILMESMGLYDQESREKLVGGFIKDTLIDTPIAIGKRVIINKDLQSIKNGLQIGTDIIFGMLKEVKRSHVKYPKKMTAQINEMFYKSNRLKDIKTPVILIQGINDPVSNPKKFMPIASTLKGGPHNPEREKFLKETIFPSSPYVKLLVGKKAIPHHVMPIEDADRVARASLYLIEKANKKNVSHFSKIKLLLFKRN